MQDIKLELVFLQLSLINKGYSLNFLNIFMLLQIAADVQAVFVKMYMTVHVV
jgi:hypothetical protein